MRVNDKDIRIRRFRNEKLVSIEYMGYDKQHALQDYENRIAFQLKKWSLNRGMTVSYDDIENDESYVYCIAEINRDNRKRYITNYVRGYLPTTIVSFVMNLHPEPKPIYFTRHGQSEYNIEDRIGGDPNLTAFGKQYAARLGKWLLGVGCDGRYVSTDPYCDVHRLAVWTSCLQRTVQTAQYIECNSRVKWTALNEIDAGICENLTYQEMGQKYPDVAKQRKKDKLNYRYPEWMMRDRVICRGESYMDIIERLQPVIFELERTTKPVIVVSHQAVLRCLISYFIDLPKDNIPYYSIPLHTLVRIVSREGSYDEERIPLMPVSVVESFPKYLEDLEKRKRRESI